MDLHGTVRVDGRKSWYGWSMNQSESKQAMHTPEPSGVGRSPSELIAIGAFVIVHLLAPILLGERYPFTVSPMFSDQPSQYCTYEIFDSAGQNLDPELFGLHLVYDGNPPGLGMGIKPTPTLHAFGEFRDESTVRQHVQQVMQQNDIAGPLTIKRTHVAGGEPQLKTTIDNWVVTEAEAQTP